MVLGTRLSKCRSIVSFSKLTYQMWGVVLLGAGVGALNKILKREGRQISLPTKTI